MGVNSVAMISLFSDKSMTGICFSATSGSGCGSENIDLKKGDDSDNMILWTWKSTWSELRRMISASSWSNGGPKAVVGDISFTPGDIDCGASTGHYIVSQNREGTVVVLYMASELNLL